MFTAEQLKTAHAKIKSGADFPAYIQEIKQMDLAHYETFVTDGHTIFYGNDGHYAQWHAKYTSLSIATNCNKDAFVHALREHQQGKSNYPTFCKQSAAFGIEKWVTDLNQMTCSYYDTHGNQVLTEQIPI